MVRLIPVLWRYWHLNMAGNTLKGRRRSKTRIRRLLFSTKKNPIGRFTLADEMKNTILIFLAISLLFCFSCRQGAPAAGKQTDGDTSDFSSTLKAGDIIFQDLDCGPLCEAIEAVTQGAEGRDFSHCAMAVEHDGKIMLAEAIGSGVQLTPLAVFLQRSGDTGVIKNLMVARLAPSYQHLIPEATQFTLNQLGQPYDREFIMDNGSWYCSELIYEAFRQANDGEEVFSLEPMTFKAPGTEDYFPVWKEYYEELGAPIPEGDPGINPGLISRSPKLQIVEN